MDHKQRCKEYYFKNKDKWKGYAKTFREKNLDKCKEWCKRYKLSENGIIAARKGREKYFEKHPERRNLHKIVARKLKKEPFQVCGEKRVHAHHEDHSKPLDVMWFCIKHHCQLHASEKEYNRLVEKYL